MIEQVIGDNRTSMSAVHQNINLDNHKLENTPANTQSIWILKSKCCPQTLPNIAKKYLYVNQYNIAIT